MERMSANGVFFHRLLLTIVLVNDLFTYNYFTSDTVFGALTVTLS